MKEKLEILLKENTGTIAEAVITEALSEEDPKYFFEHLLQYGCQSWFVWSMIRYSDTHVNTHALGHPDATHLASWVSQIIS